MTVTAFRWHALVVITLLTAWTGAEVVQGKTVYVSPSGNDANNGSSWVNAKLTVKAGITATASGDQVWVAAGTYVERVSLKVGVGLYGGFAGSETMLSQRNWKTNQTILDGDRGGSVVSATAGTTTATRIDGFTIRNGSSSGVYCSSAVVTIANNLITGNSSSLGGGIYCYSRSPTIVNNTIITNSAGSGGGIYCRSCSPIVTNNTIVANGGSGGGIYCDNASPNITNTIIAGNSSGIFNTGSGTPTLRYSCLHGNDAYDVSGLADPSGTNSNILTDPKLANVAYGNAHLQLDSPCKDVGDDAVVQAGSLDIDGEARIQGDHVDIGADESDGTLWPIGPKAIVRVSPDGNDANDGSSWLLPKQTVQAAINQALTIEGEVWVKSGIYRERITLLSYAHVYGGFAGTENRKDDRAWASYPTILDGDQGGSVVTAVQSGFQTSTVDGFTIRNGTGTVVGTHSFGGGIHCLHASPSIANNLITENSVKALGGAIYCERSSATILGNTISRNTAGSGGGINLRYSSARIANNNITENVGGGVHCALSSTILTNNLISQNSISLGCAGISCQSGFATIINNTIVQNGAGSARGGLEFTASSALIINNIISFNSMGVRQVGSGQLTFRSNCVYGNLAANYHELADPTGTLGNISVDPRLANRAYGDAHIQPDSPCRNSGDGTVVEVDWLDIDGMARVEGDQVDIGADESDGTVWSTGPNIIVRVSPNGDDTNDGSSWSLAKRTVQAGIAAASSARGDIWVEAGTYLERITLLPYVHLYGGFAGTEIERQQRDWGAHEVILDGQEMGSVVTASGLGLDASTIDGFTIRNGKASSGGGILCSSASPIITHNTIRENMAEYGGGIRSYCSSPVIIGNQITENSGTNGGGIYASNSQSLRTENNMIDKNTASSQGGGTYFSSSVTIANNAIAGNSAPSGGGVYIDSYSPILINNSITGNVTTFEGDGGAIYCSGSTPTLVNNVVAFNSSGMFSTSGLPSLHHNCFYGNMRYSFSGVTDPTGVDGNISLDPLLADIEQGNVHIQPDSPCKDSGDSAVVQAAWLDMDGQARILDSQVDIGADESDGTTWPRKPRVVVRVKPLGDDANDGSSWELAKRTVQAGIGCASAVGGEVWVASGAYLERIDLLAGAHVYGGFNGSEDARELRDWSANPTVIDGQQGGSVVKVVDTGFGSNTIDGFTICNGTGTIAGSILGGGGIYCFHAAPMIANNKINGNAVGDNGYGGGIYCGYASPTVAHNTIVNNRAKAAGGGVYCEYSFPKIDSNTIVDNAAAVSGGGICCVYSSPAITNNSIARNIIDGDGVNTAGGGLMCGGPGLVIGNVITENSAGYGGGIHCGGNDLRIIGNTITANSSGREGGGIYVKSYTDPIIASNIVAFNSSGIYQNGSGTVTLRCNCVYGNSLRNYVGMPDPGGSNGNIAVDPKLANLAYGNTHIQPDSPCRDAGDDAATSQAWVDIDGQPRIRGKHVDIGADESDGTLWPTGPNVIVRVSVQGDDANDGSSWSRPKRTVQAGINAASIPGGEVWVQGGTYLGRITLLRSASVYGGFAGTETTRQARNWSAPSSILDGENFGPVVTSSHSGFHVSAIDGFTIRNGSSSSFGGGILCDYSSPLIANNVIIHNSATFGGAIFCRWASPTLIKNVIRANAAGWGGAIGGHMSSPTIAGNTILLNSAETHGGGIRCSSSSPIIAHNLISGNYAKVAGGGIYDDGDSSTIIGNTITANIGFWGGGSGGGIYFGSNKPSTIVNNIVAFNLTGISRLQSGTLDLRHNCVFGNTLYDYSGVSDPTGANGNISQNPRFVRDASCGPDNQWGTADDDNGDLRLQPTSPCIDAGDNAAVPADLLADLSGRSRFVDNPSSLDTGAGTPPLVDMGAYEYQPTAPADFNDDGQVDTVDLGVFLACSTGPAVIYNADGLPVVGGCTIWPGSSGTISADFDADGDVDQDDFGVLQRCFSGVEPADPGCAD
jgi:hypothetical protein